MNLRALGFGVLALATLQGFSGTARADRIEIGVSTNPSSYGVAEIRVDGPSNDGPYTEIRNETIEYIVSVRGDPPDKGKVPAELEIQFLKHNPMVPWDGGAVAGSYVIEQGVLTKEWLKYKVAFPYVDPWSREVANQKFSPVKFCNDNLQHKTGAARQKMLKDGLSVIYHGAFLMRGYVRYKLDKLVGDKTKDYGKLEPVPVKITCMNLDRPRVRTQTSTQGVDPKPGQKMKPTISEVSFKIEPAQIEKMGKFLCPTQLRLYGRLETIRDFTGKSIFAGPYYLSPITEIKMAKAGNRNMVGTYMMKWHEMGGKAIAPDAEPKKQSLTFKFNVSNKDGKVLESVEKSIQVSCGKIKVNAPTVDGGMTVAPSN